MDAESSGSTWIGGWQDDWSRWHDTGGKRGAAVNRQAGQWRNLYGVSDPFGKGERHRDPDAGRSGETGPEEIEERFQ